MLGAAMLARTAKIHRDPAYLDVAREAMVYSCSRQLADGAWYYGESEHSHWIDNFHTGYNLDSLKCYIESSGDTAFEENLKKGLKFFKDHFFEPSGRPKYYHDRAYPIDSQCASQAIETLANFSDYDPDHRWRWRSRSRTGRSTTCRDKKGYLLLPSVPARPEGQDAHASLGASDDLPGVGPPLEQTGQARVRTGPAGILPKPGSFFRHRPPGGERFPSSRNGDEGEDRARKRSPPAAYAGRLTTHRGGTYNFDSGSEDSLSRSGGKDRVQEFHPGASREGHDRLTAKVEAVP